jgi:ferredoxin
MDCPCKKTLGADGNDINSCLAVGKKLASFWLDHGEKYHARKISQEEALALIVDFRKRGHLTQAFFKVATGGSTGVICNCHPDTCVSLKATKFARRFSENLTMNADAGYAVRRDGSRCRTCGDCAGICPAEAIELRGNEWLFDRGACLGCELCVEHCGNGALSLVRDPEKSVPLDIDIIRSEYAERN